MFFVSYLQQIPRSETGGISNLGTKANLLSQTTSNCCNNIHFGTGHGATASAVQDLSQSRIQAHTG